MTRQEAEVILLKKFKTPKFYDEQWQCIERLLNGERVLLIEKTGFGKSLCFQFPAIIFEGITVIFTPLIALMRDQVKKLTTLGIAARCIHSDQTADENTKILALALQGKLKLLYIAPERQESHEWIAATQSMNLSMVVIDEAHCISVWGHDFRPAFKRIINLVNLLPNGLPVLATTATATKKVQEDVAKQIGGNLSTLRGNLMRENFKLFVVKVSSDDEKMIWLGQNLNLLLGSGILYAGTRVETEIYTKWLDHLGIPCMGYNAGLDGESRVAIENGLIKNLWKCVISTNALGMGIDKPDIRFIIHSQFPQSPIHYYQEIGRAGRDGQPAAIILLYNPADRKLPESFIEGARPSIKKYELVIEAIKTAQLGERELMRQTNLKQNQVRVIKADLMEQGIIREVMNGSSKRYEFVPSSGPLDARTFEILRNSKLEELESMIEYMETTESRMNFLCQYLGDRPDSNLNNCDNTGEKKKSVTLSDDWMIRLKAFRENYFPNLELEGKGSNIVNGVASSYYAFSNVGTVLHRSKYENGGDFPDFLLKLTLKAFRSKFEQEKFDLVVYVPPTQAGHLVKNFAVKMAAILGFPISHDLQKVRGTREQRLLENRYLKSENVRNAFVFRKPHLIRNKNILLIDDIVDSGATLKEVGKHLTDLGAARIAPVVIARTVGGDLV